MSDQSKKIDYEDLDQAVKVSYWLGSMDGRADVQRQLEDMRQRLSNMLTTNKRLFRLLNEEHAIERNKIKLSPTFVRALLMVLKKVGDYNRYNYLKKEYEKATDEKCEIKW